MNKKKLLSLALVVVLIATISFGTLAWFNDKDEVTNKFMIANSESDPDEIFSVDVQEMIDTNEDGIPDTIVSDNDDDTDADGATYKDILPGSVLVKQPIIKNTGAYAQYIRVKVTTTNADAWIAALGNGYDLGTMFEGHDETKWIRYEPGVYNGASENTYTMTFYLKDQLPPTKSVTLFDAVVIPSQLTQAQMAFVNGEFELKIVAEAIQTENLGIDTNSPDAAYLAFEVFDQTNP